MSTKELQISKFSSCVQSSQVLCSNLLVYSSPSFWEGKGGGRGVRTLCRGSGFEITGWPQGWLCLSSSWVWSNEYQELLSVACRKLNLIHTKGHKALKSFFVTLFQLFVFHRNNYLLRIIWRAQICMLLLCLNISHFTILHFILHYRSIFCKATIFNQHIWW